jgi:hypothetical protein
LAATLSFVPFASFCSSIPFTRDPEPRRTEDGIEILPWQAFLTELWSGAVMR